MDDGGLQLRLRSSGVSKEGRIPVKAHMKGELEACLHPSGYTCLAEGGGKKCPWNGLMLEKEFAQHGHETEKGGAVVKKPSTEIVVPKSHEKVYKAVCDAKLVGHPNLVSPQMWRAWQQFMWRAIADICS